LGIKIERYYASEIEPYAIDIAKKNYPDIIHIGDVTKIDFSKYKNVDIVIGGSPCQGFSFCGKRLEFKDDRSSLIKYFFEAVETIKPKYFFLENVKMRKECSDYISERLGVEYINFDSKNVAACRRNRLYWTNLKFNEENMYSRTISNIVDDYVDESYYLSDERKDRISFEQDGELYIKNAANKILQAKHGDGVILSRTFQTYAPLIHQQSHCIRAQNPDDSGVVLFENGCWKIRKFTLNEMEKMFGLPVGYTLGNSERKSKMCIGNGWELNTITRFFNCLKEEIIEGKNDNK
jgi:site-specific DNA-cytosine methylase